MHAHIKRSLLSALLAVAALPSFAADDVKLDDKFNAAAMASTLLSSQSDGNRAVYGLKRIAIASFDVEFATKGSASASATRMGQANSNGTNNRANATTYMSLGGVSDADLQAIVDQLHTDFVAQLKSAGIEVVPFDKIALAETYRKMVSGGQPSPHKKSGGNESSTVFTAEGRPVAGVSLATGGGGLAALTNFGAITSTMFSGPDIAKELDATVINVRMNVRFVEMASSSSTLFGRISGSATVDSKVSPTIAASKTTVHIFTPQGGGAYTLEKPIQIDPAAFVGVKDVTSTGSKATMVGLAVLSMALGKSDSNSIKEFEAVADPVRYRELVGGGLGQVGSMMVERLKTLR